MKKSECFKLAQYAVIENQTIHAKSKIEVLRALMTEEDIAKMVEEHREGKDNEEN